MFNKIFPKQFDNTYHGHKLALWLFALIVFMKVAMSLNSIFNGHQVATTADGIPLDTFTPAATKVVVSFFAIWGLAQLMICLICILAIARYRAMVSFMLALLLVEHLFRRLIFQIMPIDRTGSSPAFFVNLALLIFMIVGLALSLRSQNVSYSQV